MSMRVYPQKGKKLTLLTDVYLLFGMLIHVALLGLVDWLGYRHWVRHGYDHTLLALAILNVAIFFGLYYLVWLPVARRIQVRRTAREARR
ncbi:MAG: hypothetical protein AB7N91_06340 [Candidatus Tectimicrobiota bacterium]